MNQWIYDFAVWLDTHAWSTGLHESYYMYNWIESTHVITLMLSLGMLFLIDLRMLGWALPQVPASTVAKRLNVPMLVGFSVMIITGVLLFYAIPVRTAQSLWFRIKVVLLLAAALNAWLFHRRMQAAPAGWDTAPRAPSGLRLGAGLSLAFWALIVLCGRFIAYDWFDCNAEPGDVIGVLAGCTPGQTQF
ncbi:MAG: DUF6644 family protein [Halioglobus sp.]|nr:DUF6644 family protein [Halioglobus sp.]